MGLLAIDRVRKQSEKESIHSSYKKTTSNKILVSKLKKETKNLLNEKFKTLKLLKQIIEGGKTSKAHKSEELIS